MASAAEIALDRMLRAIADPSRRKILRALKQGPTAASNSARGLCAGEVEEKLKLAQSTISHHMAVLCRAGLVQAHRQGLWVRYRRDEQRLQELATSLRRSL
jgi:ArsR family transcriptional regulator